MRKLKLIEGRKPNYILSLGEDEITDEKLNNVKNKTYDKQYYLDLIQKYIKIHKSASRKDIDKLLWNKLPEWMDDKQRKNKIRNLIIELSSQKNIENIGADKKPQWIFAQKVKN